jgi:hypothetical protein
MASSRANVNDIFASFLPVRDIGEGQVTEADAYLPLRALARYGGLGRRTLRKYLTHAAHPLPHYRIGGKIVARRSEFDAWAAQFRIVRPSVSLVAAVARRSGSVTMRPPCASVKPSASDWHATS